MQINPNIPPPNGFKFLNEDGTLITGLSWPNLERKVIEYRRRTGGNVDTVHQDILEQVCKAAPGFCVEDRAAMREEIRVRENLKARLMKWLGEMSGHRKTGPLAKVDENVAKQRAHRCLACRRRVNADMGCTSCQKNVERLRMFCLDNHHSAAPGLGGCDITGEDLAVSIHLRQQPIVSGDLPDYCWRRNS